jgi:hypothetical protein
MSEATKENPSLKLYKAIVVVSKEVEEVPVWATSIDEALSFAESQYGDVQRIRSTPRQEPISE